MDRYYRHLNSYYFKYDFDKSLVVLPLPKAYIFFFISCICQAPNFRPLRINVIYISPILVMKYTFYDIVQIQGVMSSNRQHLVFNINISILGDECMNLQNILSFIRRKFTSALQFNHHYTGISQRQI